MLSKNFSYDFQISQQDYGEQFLKKLHPIHLVEKLITENNNKEYFISVNYLESKYHNLDKFKQLSKLKYIGILQPRARFIDNDQINLVYIDYLKYGLNWEKLQNLVNQNQGNRILLQLALTFAELERRNYRWPLKAIEDLYYIDGLLMLSLADCDMQSINNASTCFETFSIFVRYYQFSYFFPEIEEYLKKNSFKPLIDFLLEKEGNMHKINYLDPPHEIVLKYLLSINVLAVVYQFGNSVVKSFETPQLYKSHFQKLGDQIVYKSTKYQQQEFKNQISINITREIELMEEFSENSFIAACFLYFRIDDYSFLLSKKYAGTLADALAAWKPTDSQIKKDVYTFCQRFAIALKDMHQQNIIHRDLKPENLFLDNVKMDNGNVYIADLDRSKQLTEEQNQVLTTLNCANTPKYDPPEETQNLKYDIFQYALICLTVANKGVYVGMTSPRMMTEKQHQEYYSLEAITKRLANFNYQTDFIETLAKCLYRQPHLRPNAEEVYAIMNKLNLESKIKIVQSLNSSLQRQDSISSNTESSSPLKIQRNSFQNITPITPEQYTPQFHEAQQIQQQSPPQQWQQPYQQQPTPLYLQQQQHQNQQSFQTPETPQQQRPQFQPNYTPQPQRLSSFPNYKQQATPDPQYYNGSSKQLQVNAAIIKQQSYDQPVYDYDYQLQQQNQYQQNTPTIKNNIQLQQPQQQQPFYNYQQQQPHQYQQNNPTPQQPQQQPYYEYQSQQPNQYQQNTLPTPQQAQQPQKQQNYCINEKIKIINKITIPQTNNGYPSTPY